jgi:hypothetical protein
MSLVREFRQGAKSALVKFKLAGPMGADIGVAPRGGEQSHGTERLQYPARSPASNPDGQDPDMSSWLWDVSDVDRLAPGNADGSFGQEVIG